MFNLRWFGLCLWTSISFGIWQSSEAAGVSMFGLLMMANEIVNEFRTKKP
jgi:hypothetical protein